MQFYLYFCVLRTAHMLKTYRKHKYIFLVCVLWRPLNTKQKQTALLTYIVDSRDI